MQFISWYFCVRRNFAGQPALKTKVYAQSTILFKLLPKFDVVSKTVYLCEFINLGLEGQTLFHQCTPLTMMFLSDMEFLEVLTEGLDRVLLVRGGGCEVITIYS